MTKQPDMFAPPDGPSLYFEDMSRAPVAGVDEVGRGPWAGPVVAAAVILDPGNIPAGLNDSKKLSPERRAELAIEIQNVAIATSIAEASVAEIDQLNILAASMLAMRRAVGGLTTQPNSILVDGNRDPGFETNGQITTRCIVKGDGLSLSIAAASIIAKVFRDELMAKLSQSFPDYGWERNAGYGVPHHRQALSMVGVSPHHRKSFAPIAKILDQES